MNAHHHSVPHGENAFQKLVGTISLALCKLHHIQFDAPWNPRRQGC